MTNLNDTGESIPAYHIDHTLYEGRPADTSGREDKEIRTYDSVSYTHLDVYKRQLLCCSLLL